MFNIASGNYTVGEVADYVKIGVKEALDIDARVIIKNVQYYRNYKVSTEKARNMLSFKPRFDVEHIVKELAANLKHFDKFDTERFYNIRVFKAIYPNV